MSAAGDAPPPPNQPSRGRSGPSPSTINNIAGNNTNAPIPNGWTKDEKTKTCKCEPCGDRVRFWSYKCTECGRHVCSECLDSSSEKSNWAKSVAEDHINNSCWHAYHGNMKPGFEVRKPPPHVRTVEERKAREAKGLSSFKKVPKPRLPSKQTPSVTKNESNTGSRSSTSAPTPSIFDRDYEGPPTSEPTIAAVKVKRTGIKRKSYLEENSSSEISSDEEEFGLEKKKMKSNPIGQRVGSLGNKKTGNQPTTTHRAARVVQFSNCPQDVHVAPAFSHIDGASTVIVGAGIVGLFAARELGLEVQKANIKHNITVIDIKETYCTLASGHCAGFLTTTGAAEQWSPITDVGKGILAENRVIS